MTTPEPLTDEARLDFMANYWEGDEDIHGQAFRVVTTRAKHKCVMDEHTIPPGTRAVAESAFTDDGPMRCWTCVECVDRRMKEEMDEGVWQ